jgi:hypothetical protein
MTKERKLFGVARSTAIDIDQAKVVATWARVAGKFLSPTNGSVESIMLRVLPCHLCRIFPFHDEFTIELSRPVKLFGIVHNGQK